MGNFRHQPNIEGVQFLVEHIVPHFRQVRFIIAGSHTPDNVCEVENVCFSGYVADTRTLYNRPNTIVVAPLFSGTGQRVKLLEAFAMACPVVTTSIGAKGFPVRDRIDALIARTAEDFVADLKELVSSVELRRELGANAR